MRASLTVPLVAAAVLSAVLVAVVPAVADETPAVLTTGAAGTDGANVAAGDVVNASLVTGTTAFFANSESGTTGVTCTTSSFTATVTDNPVAPGTATESTTDQQFSGCTANITGVTGVNGVTVNSTPMATTVDSTGAVTVGSADAPVQTTIALSTLLGSINCVYAATNGSISGVASNTGNSITFTSQPFTKSSGSILCPASGFFNASYGPVLDTTVEGSPAVFTN
jgi:hypothetical protein